MYKQLTTTYTWDGSGGPYNYPADWFEINTSGYDTIAVTITSANGWDGDVSFWGGTGVSDAVGEAAPALWALNDASNASLVTQVSNIVGATPTAFAKNYRGSIAGLITFGVYFANPTSFESAIGTIKVEVGLYASAK